MTIYDSEGRKVLDVTVDDNSYRNRAIMGDNNLTLHYSLAEHVEIPVGAYCNFENVRYTLMRPESFKMKHSRSFEYTVIMEAAEAKAKIWKFRNTVDGRLKFPLTAKPKEHLQMFVDNMNRRDNGWVVGQCVDGAEVLISYDHAYCYEALAQMASELKTEFEFNGKVVSLRKVEYNKNSPLALSYGRGNGFKPNVGRSNYGDNVPVEILFIQGGVENIDRSKYGSNELLLPKLQQIAYDGQYFEDEDAFNADNARRYITDDLGLSIRRADKELTSLAEDSLDCSEIYPKRVGTISKVVVVDEKEHFYDIIDSSIPDSLNYEDYLIAGETMTVKFQSGMLAGKEFEVKYIHEAKNVGTSKEQAARRFEIVPQEIDGQTMPNSTFAPKAGDTYAVFNCMLPDAYLCDNTTKSGASWDMFRAGVKYLFDNEEVKFAFTGELDGLWSKKDWVNIGGKIKLGGYIKFSDERFQKEGVLVRITGIKDYINKPHSPELTLSNSTVTSGFSTTIKELQSEEVLIQESHRDAIQYTKRRFRDAKETISMLEDALLENFTKSINPIAVQTMSMLVGDESLQFRFIDSLTNPVQVGDTVVWDGENKQLKIGASCIQHLTLGIKDISSSHSEYYAWQLPEFTSAVMTDGEKSYYLYAKCSATDQTGDFVLSETAIKMTDVSGYYHLLVGVLNSEYDGERSFASLYGFTEVLPGRITTDRIVSGSGTSYFDMLNNAMKLGNVFDFNSQGDGKLRLQGTIVQSQSGVEEYIGCYRGVYNAAYTYYQGDEVTYTVEGLTSTYRYIYETPAKGVAPTSTVYWQVVAAGSKGEKGEDGINGINGVDGISPNTAYKSTVFIRTNTPPETPTGGSYDNPVPKGWSDAIPSGEQILWASTRIFSSDGEAPQQSEWSAPRQMTDTADFDVEYSSAASPKTPSGHPNTTTGWSNTANENTIWMATCSKKNGVWEDWQVSRIKGENGEDGTSIRVKGTLASVDKLPETPSDPSDCYIIGQDLYVWDGDSWENVGQFKGDKGDSGANGIDGKNAFVHIKYANSLTKDDWTDNNGETPGNYIGIYSDASPTDSLNWDDYSWKRWTGEDGFGYEYIYKRTTSDSAPTTPTTISQTDGYVPSGWTANPSGVSSTYKFEWICYRKKTDGSWGSFVGSNADKTKAALWAKYGDKGDKGDSGNDGSDGEDGKYTELRFAKNGSTSTAPSLSKTAASPTGWSTTVPSVGAAEYLWMTKAEKDADGGLLGEWSTPVRITPYDGKDGKDGANGSSPVMVFRGVYDSSKTYYGNSSRLDCVKYSDTYYIARIDAGTFSGKAPTNTSYWNSFGASFESVATNLLLAENANIGDWFISGGKIVSTLENGNKIELDAKNKIIKITSASSGGTYSQETLGSNITIDANSGIVEARATNGTSAVSYLSPTGVFANRAGTQCVAASTGYTQRAAVVGLGYGNLNKSAWVFGADQEMLAGVYGTSSNSGTAPHYGGVFQMLKAYGLVLNVETISSSATSKYIYDSDSLVVSFATGTCVTYLPAAIREGQIIFLKQINGGKMRVYPRSGQHIYDDNTENDYYDVGSGQMLIAVFCKCAINNVTTEVWWVNRIKY